MSAEMGAPTIKNINVPHYTNLCMIDNTLSFQYVVSCLPDEHCPRVIPVGHLHNSV